MSSNSFRERFTVTGLRERAAANSMIGKRTNKMPLLSSIPAVRVVFSRRAYMTFAVLLIGSRSIAAGSSIQGDSPETLLALMLALPAQVVVGHTPPVIEEEGKLQLPFLAHSRHSASYHRKSAHFSRNNGNRRIKVFGVMFRGDFQGKYGHRAALKCPIVLRTGQTTPRRFVVFG